VALKKLVQNQTLLFWFLQFSGWIGYGMITWIGAAAHEVPSSYNYVIIVSTIFGLILTLGLRHIFHWLSRFSSLTRGIGSLLSCYLISLPWILSKNLSIYYFYKGGWYPDSYFVYFAGVTAAFYIILLCGGLYYGIKYSQMLQR